MPAKARAIKRETRALPHARNPGATQARAASVSRIDNVIIEQAAIPGGGGPRLTRRCPPRIIVLFLFVIRASLSAIVIVIPASHYFREGKLKREGSRARSIDRFMERGESVLNNSPFYHVPSEI